MTSEKKTITAGELFTHDEMRKAFKIIGETSDNPIRMMDRLLEEVVRDALPRIDKVTGQANVPRFVAYQLQYLYNVAMSAALQKTITDLLDTTVPK